jgi:CTP:molybdopterin cytidylyltransferase MocA
MRLITPLQRADRRPVCDHGRPTGKTNGIAGTAGPRADRLAAMRIGGIVLAAGEGKRFGGAVKQLAELDGRSLLQHALDAAAGVDPLVVVLGAHADEILAAAALGDARPVICESWRDGQSASLQAGVKALGDVDAAVVLLADQPTDAAAVERVMRASPPARATYAGRPGHPVLLGRAELDRVALLEGDEGARSLLAGATEVPCDGRGVDIDTPEQLEAFR